MVFFPIVESNRSHLEMKCEQRKKLKIMKARGWTHVGRKRENWLSEFILGRARYLSSPEHR